ncbi:MAG: glycerophosphodiester phosphodiesterase [Candidatus Binatia bacterium]
MTYGGKPKQWNQEALNRILDRKQGVLYWTLVERSWLRIAHRGASGGAPEHTRRAFERALAVGVDMIELDVQLSRDQELVVMHDHELERTTTGSGLVREHDFADLRALDAGSWFASEFAGERVMSLREVVLLVDGHVRLNVEIKAPSEDWHVLAKELTTLLRRHGQLDRTVISSFEPGALQVVRTQASDARLGLLWQAPDLTEAWRWSREVHAASIHPHWLLVREKFMCAARQHGLQAFVWTVNDVETMRELVRREVDGIISDFPERFRLVAGTMREV